MDTTMNLQCVHCDETHQISVNYEDVQAWKNGALIQDVRSYLHADLRELLISKTCGPWFDKMFGVDFDE